MGRMVSRNTRQDEHTALQSARNDVGKIIEQRKETLNSKNRQGADNLRKAMELALVYSMKSLIACQGNPASIRQALLEAVDFGLPPDGKSAVLIPFKGGIETGTDGAGHEKDSV